MARSTKKSAPGVSSPPAAPSPDYSESGVDRSLIRWMLSLSPADRLLAIQQQVNAVQQMKESIDSD